jgi:hypothetical protein
MSRGGNYVTITTSLRSLESFRLARILHIRILDISSGKDVQSRQGRAMHRFVGGTLKIAFAAISLTAGLSFMQPAFATLLGVDYGTGELYSISETNAATTPIGNTGITSWADIQLAPNGTLYGFTAGTGTSKLYSINPTTAAPTLIGSLNLGASVAVFEGGLAFAPNGTAYAMNSGRATNDSLFTINLTTGAATSLGQVTGATNIDINGLAYRSDGKLVGLENDSNSLVVIDPTTRVLSTLLAVPTPVGSVGGMTVENGVGYYVTAGPGASPTPGSDDLYSFNLSTGVSTLIGNLGFNSGCPPTGSACTDFGLSGLATAPVPVPAPSPPATFGILAAALTIFELAHRRRRGPPGSTTRQ